MLKKERTIHIIGDPNPQSLPKEQRISFLESLYANIAALYAPTDEPAKPEEGKRHQTPFRDGEHSQQPRGDHPRKPARRNEPMLFGGTFPKGVARSQRDLPQRAIHGRSRFLRI